MSNVLKNFEPNDVFKYFEEISQIPRGSGNEKAISDYMVRFAKEHNLEVIQDKAYNIIIKKPGTKGYENAPTVIIQGHMDMVCEKNKGTEHDFEKDPIKLRIVDDMIYATGTTLGADNGIAMAYAMAILASKDIPHPPIEVLMTTEEETGMGGAMALDASHIKGRMLINIDSEEEGKLLVSCSGGVRTTQKLPITWEDVNPNRVAYTISIRGLKGGHSGMEIDKGRGNSNKIMGRILNDISSEFDFDIKEINGGSKMNAIPREADAVILLNPEDLSKLEARIEEWNAALKNELRTADPSVAVHITKFDGEIKKVFSKETKEKAIASLVLIPNGIQTMSMDIEGLVESSTNLGVVETQDNMIIFQSAVRSSVKTLKYNILNQAKMVAKVLGAELEADSDYPEWQYNPDSKLRTIFENVYKEKYGKNPEIVAIHAGVECGLFSEKMEGLDMISFGPDMADVHTPDEHISISSIKRTYEYLLDVLKAIK
ncbi:aminoacyl-histidine dipeptidase [Fervidicella metallireducens AeB]|uniref:Cytosol non-specific dipeptidase n=1 Tax=Fervidicella metallireducens AeB TaxID=1403537 RepID=A0A017RWY4_9CLOT|nr:aminoacyl-histidine dipeptidase [Fervidicella metallireducens]EYE88914.1 aminoacyl-histidine dipeptidase [Fervidicella metallireducens AeB]